MEHPTHDPHGDPIPNVDGYFKRLDKIVLANAKENETFTCVGVKDSSPQFLKYLDKNNIALGSLIQVKTKEAFDESMVIKINNNDLAISKEVAYNLFVKAN